MCYNAVIGKEMGFMTKIKKVFLIISITILISSAVIVTAIIWDNSLKRADYKWDGYEIDGKNYTWRVDYRELGDYNETWNIICKTIDGRWTFYEIDRFPDHEYLIARCFYNAEVIKRTD